jgi:uncharacterized protein (TIGR02118 family)
MIISVLYKVGPGQTFDHDYYMNRHIPMVRKLWDPAGLRSLKVLKGTGTVSGGPPEINVMALLDFPSMAAFQAAADAHGKEVLGDIPQFTNAPAIIQFNEVVE